MEQNWQSNDRIYRIRDRINVVFGEFDGTVAEASNVICNALADHERRAQERYPEGVIRADLGQYIDGGYTFYLSVYTLETNDEMEKRFADNAKNREFREMSLLRERAKMVETITSGKLFTKDELQAILDRME